MASVATKIIGQGKRECMIEDTALSDEVIKVGLTTDDFGERLQIGK